MADVITRFKLESTQFDSKLRDAAKGLREVTHMAEIGGKGFKDFSQKQIEAARAFGTIESGATNTKDKLKDLVGAFNDVARAYNNLTKEQQQSDFGKALSESLGQLNERIKQTKEELYGLSETSKGGGLFGGDGIKGMLQVFGGNVMTKLAGYVANLGTEITTVMNESAQLAMQAEGVQIAFERLGRGDLLDGLRDATHNTVSDFELMKAAVKFNDFKLPVEELGTMLAFAQQKAKDTGQSVDYMVDSIVTGLGRKSLMILDNLGLSANEVKEKMKETGDMTKAVGEIIREQMSKAGDYVETAADRATQANVELENAMLDLGNAMRETFGYTGWSDMATGIKTELVGALTFTIETVNEAKQRFMELLQLMGLVSKTPANPGPNLEEQNKVVGQYWFKPTKTLGTYTETTRNGKVVKAERDNKVLFDYTKKAGSGKKQNTPEYIDFYKQTLKTEAQDLKNVIDPGSVFEKFKKQANFDPENILGSKSVWESYKDTIAGTVEGIGDSLNNLSFDGFMESYEAVEQHIKDLNENLKKQKMAYNLAGQAAQNFGAALQGIDNPAAKAAGTVMQAVASIALGFAMASSQANTAGSGWGWLAWLAAGAAAMATTISTIHSLTGYAEGGIVKGNSYSGDNIGAVVDGSQFVGLNAGELVLNASQQNMLASNLQGKDRGISIVGEVQGEKIVLVANRFLKRSGQGEILTW